MGKFIALMIVIFSVVTGAAIWSTIEITQTTKEIAHKYISAPQFTNDEEIKFNWDSNRGYAFIKSTVKPVNGKVARDSKGLLDGDYAVIIAQGAEYNLHTRVVSYTDGDGNTHVSTETYWEWDRNSRLDYSESAGLISYGGIEFDASLFKDNFYKDTIESPRGWYSSRVRWSYYVVEFNKPYTSYANLASDTPNFSLSTQEISSLIKKFSGRNNLWLILVWMAYIMIVSGLGLAIYCKVSDSDSYN